MNFLKTVMVALSINALMFGPLAYAVPTTDTVQADFFVSGTVPTVFSLSARALPGDLDLTPNAYVFGRGLGLLHFKFNTDVDKIYIQTNSATGAPKNATSGAPIVANSFKLLIKGSCTSATLAATLIDNSSPGTDIASAAAKDLVGTNSGVGIEEDCELAADWQTTAAYMPLAGKYTLQITVTMIAQ